MKSLLVLSLLALFGCASVPEYQKAGADGWHRLGYEDMKVSSTQYRVKYLDASSQKAYRGFMHRAAELTVAAGYSNFKVSQIGDAHEAAMMVGLGAAANNWALDQYEATVTFVKAADVDTFDANEILAVKVGKK